eukprot:SRR837773.13613.p1 GENE.SRR837773.13613~~SRR837773.13613.p1  ORF type:complete len:299 (-),score=36.91 SRR837773.13613:68-964(-)
MDQELERCRFADAELEEAYVKHLGYLNSIANCDGKGRDDFSRDILVAARQVLRAPACTEDARHGVACFLALNVVRCYDALREYLGAARLCLDRVDPHLRNNRGLVLRLVDWEDAWGVAVRYLCSKVMLDGICDVVVELMIVQGFVPELLGMVQDRSPDVFLALPRLLVLSVLDDPLAPRRCLMETFSERYQAGLPDPDLQSVADSFQEVVDQFSSRALAWEAMVRLAVLGEEAELPAAASPRRPALAALLRRVEALSLELQRRQPQDWNNFLPVLLACMGGFTRDDGSCSGPFCSSSW